MSKMSRRDFLRKSALVVGASVLTACLQRPPKGSTGVISTYTGEDLKRTGTLSPHGEGTPLEPPHALTTPHVETTHADTVVFKTPPEQALQYLMSGNQRFVSGQVQHPRQDLQRRRDVLGGQSPFAIVLTCSDSRVPPEILFDQGIGDIFVVRTAGNVAGNIALGSIEYAVEHLGASLIVVMGHQKCGAVTAAAGEGENVGHIARVVEAIKPSVEKVRAMEGDLVSNAINQNVLDGVAALASSEPILKRFVQPGKVEVVGARYELDTGGVSFISASEKLRTYLPTSAAYPSATLFHPETSSPENPDSTETRVYVEPTATQPVGFTETPSVWVTTTPGVLGKHIVRAGETLLAIARAYRVDPDAIARYNHLSNPNRLSIDQVLWIPDVYWENPSYGPVAQRQF